jgi:hypothetical protein
VAKRTRKTKSRAARTASRQAWTKEQVADLRRHSKAKTRVMRLEKNIQTLERHPATEGPHARPLPWTHQAQEETLNWSYPKAKERNNAA